MILGGEFTDFDKIARMTMKIIFVFPKPTFAIKVYEQRWESSLKKEKYIYIYLYKLHCILEKISLIEQIGEKANENLKWQCSF